MKNKIGDKFKVVKEGNAMVNLGDILTLVEYLEIPYFIGSTAKGWVGKEVGCDLIRLKKLTPLEGEEGINNKYNRNVKGTNIDVYDVLLSWDVRCPATQHAIKKLLMPGQRGHKDKLADLKEAKQSIQRAIELLEVPYNEE